MLTRSIYLIEILTYIRQKHESEVLVIQELHSIRDDKIILNRLG